MYEYEGNLTEYVENMKEYVKNMKKYVKNIKEYEEICQYIGSIWALGLGKIPSTAEVSLFCLLHISSKLFLLTYNSRPQKCQCLGRRLPQTRAVSTQHVNS